MGPVLQFGDPDAEPVNPRFDAQLKAMGPDPPDADPCKLIQASAVVRFTSFTTRVTGLLAAGEPSCAAYIVNIAAMSSAVRAELCR